MKTITVTLSDQQSAAIQAVAKKMRMEESQAVLVLAFLPLSFSYDDLPTFREALEEVAEAVLDGRVDAADEGLAGVIPFRQTA